MGVRLGLAALFRRGRDPRHLAQGGERLADAADPVDQPALYRRLAVEDRADVVCHHVGPHHHPLELRPLDMRMVDDEADDPILHLSQILEALGRRDHGPGGADGVDGHGRGGDDERPLRRNGERHADRVSAAEDHRNGGFVERRDHLRDGEPRLDVPAHRVEQDQDPVDPLVLLEGEEQGDQVLVFGGLLVALLHVMPLDLPDHVQTVEALAPVLRRHPSSALQKVPFGFVVPLSFFLCFHRLPFPRSGCVFDSFCRRIVSILF